MNIETITTSFGSLLAGDPAAAAVTSGQQPALNFADLLAAQVVVAGQMPDAVAAGRMIGLSLLTGGSPEAQVLRFDQLVELLTGPPAAATELTLDLPQEASPEADPLALITLTQMMNMLHPPVPLSSPELTTPVEVQPEGSGQDQGPEKASSAESEILPAVASLSGVPLAGELISFASQVTPTGTQSHPSLPPAEVLKPPVLNGTMLTATGAKPVVVSGENLTADTSGSEAATAEAGNFEQSLSAALPKVSARGEVELDRAAGSAIKESTMAAPVSRPQSDVPQDAALSNLRAIPVAAPAPSPANFVPVEAPTGLSDLPALQQVIDTVEFLSQKGETEVRLHLYPKELGQLHVQLQVIEGQVVVRMVAETSQAQSLIQDHLVQLKAAFSAQGLQVDQMTVNVGSGGADANSSGQPSRGSFAQSNGATPFNLPGEAMEQIHPEPRKSRTWGLVHSVDYKI